MSLVNFLQSQEERALRRHSGVRIEWMSDTKEVCMTYVMDRVGPTTKEGGVVVSVY